MAGLAVPLNNTDPELLARVFNHASFLPPTWHETSIQGPVLTLQDWADLAERYGRGEVLVIDNFLSAEALLEMKINALGATMWMETRLGDYVGSLQDDGFALPVVKPCRWHAAVDSEITCSGGETRTRTGTRNAQSVARRMGPHTLPRKAKTEVKVAK